MTVYFTSYIALLLSLSGGVGLGVCEARAEDICAERFSELDRSERLESLKALFGGTKQIRAVNGSQGSYVVIDSLNDDLTISFFTSGLFDLYPIRKDGPLKFCDSGDHLKMIGLGRTEIFEMVEGKFRMGGGGKKKTFAPGEMPVALQKLHRLPTSGIAAKP